VQDGVLQLQHQLAVGWFGVQLCDELARLAVLALAFLQQLVFARRPGEGGIKDLFLDLRMTSPDRPAAPAPSASSCWRRWRLGGERRGPACLQSELVFEALARTA
jgi:hypothetical protein